MYFAVDVMAPGYLERLSDAILESKLNIRWGAELRLEKIFSKERCRKMAESGCVSVSFGMESGNQRVLDLIDKGTKVQFMGETMKNFADAGIAVQIMAFSHFPTETEAERKETVGFVQLHQDSWSAGGIGKFVLTGTALVAKNPEKFGINLITPRDADIVRALGYKLNADGQRQMLSAEDGDESFDEKQDLFPNVHTRPWAGGTDSLHSMIYYEKHGRRIFKEKAAQFAQIQAPSAAPDDILECTVEVKGRLAPSDFEIGTIFKGRAQRREHTRQLYDSAIEPPSPRSWDGNRALPPWNGKPVLVFVIQDEKRLRLAEVPYVLLSRAVETNAPLKEILAEVDASSWAPLLDHFQWLQRKGYISFRMALASQPSVCATAS